MSDHRPKTMDSERLAALMVGLKDGQIRVDAEGDRLAVAVKCSHVEDGACAECLVPLLGTLAKALEEIASLRAEVARLTEERDEARDNRRKLEVEWREAHAESARLRALRAAEREGYEARINELLDPVVRAKMAAAPPTLVLGPECAAEVARLLGAPPARLTMLLTEALAIADEPDDVPLQARESRIVAWKMATREALGVAHPGAPTLHSTPADEMSDTYKAFMQTNRAGETRDP